MNTSTLLLKKHAFQQSCVTNVKTFQYFDKWSVATLMTLFLQHIQNTTWEALHKRLCIFLGDTVPLVLGSFNELVLVVEILHPAAVPTNVPLG